MFDEIKAYLASVGWTRYHNGMFSERWRFGNQMMRLCYLTGTITLDSLG